MSTETAITLNINAGAMLVGIFVFFCALLGIIWKGKAEIVSSIEEALKPFGTKVEKLKNNVKVISDYLISVESLPFDHTRLESYSPLKVTEAGSQYLSDVGFLRIFSEHGGDFYDAVDRESPTNDYDIENASVRSVIQLFHKDYFAPVKNYFYNHPNEDKKSFLRIAGVYVRDKYMARQQNTATEA